MVLEGFSSFLEDWNSRPFSRGCLRGVKVSDLFKEGQHGY